MHCADSKFKRFRSWLPSRWDCASTPRRAESYSQLYGNWDWSVLKCLTLVPSTSACSQVSFLSGLILLQAASEMLVCLGKFLFLVGTFRCKTSCQSQLSYVVRFYLQHVSARSVQPTRCNVSQFIYFCKTLYMFQTGFPSIIRSTKLHIQRQVFVRPLLLLAGSRRLQF